MTYEREERIALIADGCRVGQEAAEIINEQQEIDRDREEAV
jgi:hypothetical protein